MNNVNRENRENIANSDRVEELNRRLASRNVPSERLTPNYDPRPVSTKYSKMAILDHRKDSETKIHKGTPPFSIGDTFNPGDRRSHWSGFAKNVHLESELRNQLYRLGCNEDKVFIPNENSDLFNVHLAQHRTEMKSHKLLFQKPLFELSDPNVCDVGNGLFHNHTRQQRMDTK
jgi:hypothetical protein